MFLSNHYSTWVRLHGSSLLIFKSLRFRLTLWFVVFSSVAYIVTTIATGLLLHNQLTGALDNELTELIAENLRNVTYEDGNLDFVSTKPNLSTNPIRMLAAVQLFDTDGKVLHQSGSPGVATVFYETTEVPIHSHHMRSRSRKLFYNDKLVGYLQVQLPTDQREQAERKRVFMLAVTAPMLIFLLSVGGYFFTGLATRPVEEAFTILRDFMINAGHELNTPLSIAQAAVENVERNGAGPTQVSKKLPIIKLSLTRMRNLVDDLVILSKLDSNKVNRKPFQSVPLHEVVAETLQHMQPLLEERQISVSVHEMTYSYVRGDTLQLQQMLTNLLQNAISYNKPEGSIWLSLRTEENEAVLTICDSGIGISAADLPRIFDRFYRVENFLSQMTAGSGLGLSIVKAIVDFHRGTVRFDSELNVGTTAIIRLPLIAQPLLQPTHASPTHSQ